MTEPHEDARYLATFAVRGVLPLAETARVRMLKLLESFPENDARRELETIIRGGPGGDAETISLVGKVSF